MPPPSIYPSFTPSLLLESQNISHEVVGSDDITLAFFCTCWRVHVIGARCLCRNPVLCRHQEAALWRRAQQLEPAVSLTSLSDVCQSYHDTDAELRLFIKHVSMFTEAPSCHRYPVGKPFWYVLSLSLEVFYFSVYLIICPFVDDTLSLKSQSHILSSVLDFF